MAQYHYGPYRLTQGRKTSALWAVEPNRKLLLFVHGFGGRAMRTWLRFPALLSLYPKARTCDAIFYGYDGETTRAFVSALQLREFLKAISSAPNFINPTLSKGVPRRTKDFAWDDIIVVAHSLGAVVSRYALLMAHVAGDAGAAKVRLVFFAPAHSGASVLRLAGEALTGLPVVFPVAKFYYQVLQDLEPGSELLTTLKAQVLAWLSAASNLGAHEVVLAAKDRIVEPMPFIPADPPVPKVLANRSHTNVCKPSKGFHEPLAIIEDML